MKQFKKGDVVRCVKGCYPELDEGMNYTVLAVDRHLLLIAGGYFNATRFDLVSRGFQKGDIVRCVDSLYTSLTVGSLYHVELVNEYGELKLWNVPGLLFAPTRFELEESAYPVETPPTCDSMPPVAQSSDSTIWTKQTIIADFAIGDMVVVKNSGSAGKVLGREVRDGVVTEVYAGFGAWTGWYTPDELEHAQDHDLQASSEMKVVVPAFAIGDRVKCKTSNKPLYGVIDSRVRDGFIVFFADSGCRIYFDTKDLEHDSEDQVDPQADTWPPPAGSESKASGQALRYNSNKPESDYIFTYEGGIDAVFPASFDYYETLIALRDVYNDHDITVDDKVSDLLNALRSDASDCGDDIIALLAETNRLGGIKYFPGNYLAGANWRQYFQAGVRHAQKILNGEEKDAEGFPHRGNFFFNVLMLCHCITTGIGTDDRIKAP
jgi:hypothetical protein